MRQLGEKVPRAVSVANFILELKDIKSLGESLVQTQKVLRALGVNTIRAAKRKLKKAARKGGSNGSSFRELTRTAADDYLAVNFGVIPFIRDIQAMLSAHQKLLKRLRWIKKTSGKPTSVKRRRVINVDDSTLLVGYAGPNGDISGWMRKTTFTKVSLTEVVGATAFQRTPNVDDAYYRLLAWTRVLGLDRPLSVIWEAIPFSFLIDYFVDIGKMVDAYGPSADPLLGTVGLKDPWYSTKVEYSVEVEFVPTPGMEKGRNSFVAMQGKTSTYIRSSEFSGAGVSINGTLSESQARNIVALLVQRGF
jgi:hypothetical protein